MDELRILQLGWMLFLKIFSDKDKELELIQENYTSPIPADLHWGQWAAADLYTIIRLPNSVFQPYASVATNLLFFTKGEKTKHVWYYEHQLPKGYKAYSKTKPIQPTEFTELKKWWENRKQNQQAWKVDIKTIVSAKRSTDYKFHHF